MNNIEDNKVKQVQEAESIVIEDEEDDEGGNRDTGDGNRNGEGEGDEESSHNYFNKEDEDNDFNWEDFDQLDENPSFSMFENYSLPQTNIPQPLPNYNSSSTSTINNNNEINLIPEEDEESKRRGEKDLANNIENNKEKKEKPNIVEFEDEDDDDENDFDFNYFDLFNNVSFTNNLISSPSTSTSSSPSDPFFYLFQQNHSHIRSSSSSSTSQPPQLNLLEENRIKLEAKMISHLVTYLVQSLYQNTLSNYSVPLTIICLRLKISYENLIKNLKKNLLFYTNDNLYDNYKKIIKNINNITDIKEKEKYVEIEKENENEKDNNINEESNNVSDLYIYWLCTLYIHETDENIANNFLKLIHEANGTLNMEVWNHYVVQTFNQFIVTYLATNASSFDPEDEIIIPIGIYSDVLQDEVRLLPSLRNEYRPVKHYLIPLLETNFDVTESLHFPLSIINLADKSNYFSSINTDNF